MQSKNDITITSWFIIPNTSNTNDTSTSHTWCVARRTSYSEQSSTWASISRRETHRIRDRMCSSARVCCWNDVFNYLVCWAVHIIFASTVSGRLIGWEDHISHRYDLLLKLPFKNRKGALMCWMNVWKANRGIIFLDLMSPWAIRVLLLN